LGNIIHINCCLFKNAGLHAPVIVLVGAIKMYHDTIISRYKYLFTVVHNLLTASFLLDLYQYLNTTKHTTITACRKSYSTSMDCFEKDIDTFTVRRANHKLICDILYTSFYLPKITIEYKFICFMFG